MFRNQFLVEAGFVVKALEVRGSDELNQVLIPGKRFGEENKSGARFINHRFFIKTRSWCEIRIETTYRFNTLFGTSLIEINRPVEGASVRNSESFLPVFFGCFGEFLW